MLNLFKKRPDQLAGKAYSYLEEESVISRFLTAAGVQTGYAVDIAASDGFEMSNTYFLYQKGWRGLAVEFNADFFKRLAANYAGFASVNLAKCMVTPENVLHLLAAHQTPRKFEFLNLDIDGYDHFVLEQILKDYRPTLICAEINEKIPPPIKFTVKWDSSYCWGGDHFFGQSLSQLHALATRQNYSLVELHYNNAFLMPAELCQSAGLKPEEAYRVGYLDKPDRRKKFPWNEDMEEALHLPAGQSLEFINRYFKKYEGKYDISL
jgi:hypothetical protein